MVMLKCESCGIEIEEHDEELDIRWGGVWLCFCSQFCKDGFIDMKKYDD